MYGSSKAILLGITLPIVGIQAIFQAIKKLSHGFISNDRIKGYLSINPRMVQVHNYCHE